MSLPPLGSTLRCSRKKIKYSPYSTNMAIDIQLAPMGISPLLLLGSRHTYPKQIRLRCIYRPYNPGIVLI